MKKSLVVAMAMAMGVTASAYAANPFSDVPAGHWAYDSISQLEASGVIDGYGATFGGEKLMTRYEMAQIVAKAMAKGANCDKLAAEFADELDALGVRVAKLEKKVDNVKITGNIRYSYKDNVDGDGKKMTGRGKGYNRFRSRFFVNGTINKNWKYTGMLENDHYMDTQNGKEDVNLKRAFLNGRIGGVKVEAGRCYFAQSDMIDERGDGLKLSYKFDQVNVTGWALKNFAGSSDFVTKLDSDRIYMLKADTKLGKLGAFAEYWKLDCADNKGAIVELGLSYPVAKGLTLAAQYYNGKADDKYDGLDKNGWEATLKYLGAEAAKPGTWGLWFTYSDRPATTAIHPTAWNTYAYNSKANWCGADDGYKGFEFGGNYAFAKNIVGEVRYFTFEGRDNNKTQEDTLWAHLVFTF